MINMLERSELLAELFYKDSGMLAPGKSEPLERSGRNSHKERRAVYGVWYRERSLDSALSEILRLREGLADE